MITLVTRHVTRALWLHFIVPASNELAWSNGYVSINSNILTALLTFYNNLSQN